MELELDPPQPDEVVGAVEVLVETETPPADPWWRAGVDENLET